MDSVFLLEDGARSLFLQNIVEFFGCSYICLWSYLPHPSNCLLCMDGFYIDQETDKLAASSSMENSSTAAATNFDQYRKSIIVLDKINDHHIPGFAFKNGVPYLEFKGLDLQRLSSNQTQLHFYIEAKIKTAIFMGCGSGEIELGMSNITQVNMEMEMKNWFPTDFSRQSLPRDPISSDQNIPSSSSSSTLRSLSMDRPEALPLLFKQPFDDQVLQAHENPNVDIHELVGLGPEGEHAIMTKAILAVLSSTSNSNQTRPSAFKRFGSSLIRSPTPLTSTSKTGRRQDMLKRSISFFKRLNLERIRGSTSSQLQHMISERKRREKLNESFQILRSLVLSPGTKKDKVSVLSNTIDYMSSLITQISDLARKNQILEAKLVENSQHSTSYDMINNILTNGTRVDVRLSHVDTSATSSQSRIVDLHVLARTNICLSGMMTRLLEFLNQNEYISLISVNTEILTESVLAQMNRITMRLNIMEDVEWDEASFQEAVRRLVSDLAPTD